MGKDMTGDDPGSRPVDARTARRRQDPIGRRLRQMYDDVVSEEIPDDFLGFLEQADERKAGEANGQEPEAKTTASGSKP
jgi:Anti-sigma factor NepR